jgi:hypothetical protein
MIERRNADGLFPPPAYAHVASAEERLVLTAGPSRSMPTAASSATVT